MTYDPLQYANDPELKRNPLENSPPGEVVIDAETALPSAAPCDDCGSPIDNADNFCHICGERTHDHTQHEQGDSSRKFLECKSCGSQIETDTDTRSYVCAFCSSTYVVEFSPDQSNRQPPEFIIGFATPQEQAIEKFESWIKKNRWYHPGDLKQAELTGRLQGVYLPFWSFSMLVESNWSSMIGEYWYRTETYTTRVNGKTVTRTRQVRETEWWPLNGEHHRYYSGYLVSASKSLEHRLAMQVMPFDLPALKRYEPYFLAGWASEEFTIQRDQALETSQEYFYNREQTNIGAFLPGDTYRSLDVSSQFSQVNSDLVLLPYYLLSYRYKNKLYRFLINGQTGKVWGDKPLSYRRVWGVVGIGVLVLIVVIIIATIVGAIGG